MRKVSVFIWIAMLLITSLLPVPALAGEPGKTVRVGWSYREGICEEHDGVYSGYVYDYLMEIAKYTDWQYEFVESDAETAMSRLASGEIDLMGTLLYSEERDEIYDFSQLPCGNNYTLLLAPDDSELTAYDFDSFNGSRVAALNTDIDGFSLPNLAEFAD